ncbi:cytochrome P450 [Mycolicibacterium sp.]|uniref:cytochrome P450 n=1 Tax=Mycolicibacterium sp. TaxID=2320850 RepID=UPI001A2DAD40|nr:cytochrome P450 [Mycolicibacterium sp.]MBJ7336395.1 cytochrome P450 [Mycolicibacterium sp.]
MEQAPRFDPRIAPFSLSVKDLSDPQKVYYDKAKNVRAERIEGVVHLYRMADIVAINRHPLVTGTGGRGGSFGNAGALIPLEIDGNEHKKWRRLLDPMFAPKQVIRMEDSVRALAAELIDGFADDGHVDLAKEFCVPLPCLTFLRLLGAPVEDLDFFLEFKDGVIHPQGDTVEEMDANMALAGGKLLEYFANFLAKRRAETERADDIISQLLHSEVEGEALTDLELLNILFLFMFAGLDTVTSSMSCTLAWLGQHPEERRRLVEDKSLIPAAVEEIMRFESPVPGGMRYADQEDIDLGDGLVIKKGEAMYPLWAAANVDPNAFQNPLEVDFSRRANHIVFASGLHRCLGSHLARLEMRLAVEELLARIPEYSIAEGEELVYDNISVRNVTYLPITFKPRVGASA